MILSLEHLDPINGEPPKTLSQYGDHILKRSRVLLKSRNKTEIDEILAFINWITHLEEIRDFALDQLISESEADETESKPPEYIGDYSTYTFQLNLYRKKHLNTSESIPKMEWYEVYATLAIAILNEGIDDEIYLDRKWAQDKGKSIHELRILDHVSTWVVEATEAITVAEGLHQFRDHLTRTEKALSDRNTKASIEKHKKTNIAILELEKMHLTGNYKSIRNLVQNYCSSFPDKVNHLISYNRIRTLSEGLSNHLRGKRRSMIIENI